MTYIHYCLYIAGPVPALMKWVAEVYSWAVKQPTPCTKRGKFFTKGVRNHSHGVFVNQYVGHACRRRPYCRRTCLHEHCNFASGNVSGVPRLQFASAWKHVQKNTPSFLVSAKIASSVSTVLTTTMLTIEL